MQLRVLVCPRCGAPLPSRAALVRVVCEYCKSEVTIERYAVKAAEYRDARAAYEKITGSALLTVGTLRIRLLRHLATGHATEVWLGESAARLSERLVVKVLRSADDAPLLRREQDALLALEGSVQQGGELFSTWLPQRVTLGVSSASGGQLAAVFRQPIGFTHTVSDLHKVYPGGLEPRHLIWIWRRVLELLGWVHRSGWVHGCIVPAHILVHPAEHGARLLGWSCASHPGKPLVAAGVAELGLYPTAVLSGGPLSAETDLAMLARSLLTLSNRAELPRAIGHLLDREAHGPGAHDAWQLKEEVAEVAKQVFGPPRFVKLELPDAH